MPLIKCFRGRIVCWTANSLNFKMRKKMMLWFREDPMDRNTFRKKLEKIHLKPLITKLVRNQRMGFRQIFMFKMRKWLKNKLTNFKIFLNRILTILIKNNKIHKILISINLIKMNLTLKKLVKNSNLFSNLHFKIMNLMKKKVTNKMINFKILTKKRKNFNNKRPIKTLSKIFHLKENMIPILSNKIIKNRTNSIKTTNLLMVV